MSDTPNFENGVPSYHLFNQGIGRTFDDFIILPAFNDGVTKDAINLQTKLGPLTLNIPILSSPMDTVTKAEMAIALALQGGLGFLHINLAIPDAVAQVHQVKRYRMGIVTDPVCLGPNHKVSDAIEAKNRHKFATVLITNNGLSNGTLLGMVIGKNVIMAENQHRPLTEIMIPLDQLITAKDSEVTNWRQAQDFLRLHKRAEKVPIVRDDGALAGFITDTDVEKMARCPHALVNRETNQLLVGAAVSTHPRDDERVIELLNAKVDVLLVDCAQGGTSFAVKRIRQIRQLSDIPIIAGNVVTLSQAASLIEAGANALRVGMGSGSICTTQIIAGVGRALLSAVYHVSHGLSRNGYTDIAVIADGGIRYSSDIFKALACGASCVMLGSVLAACDESAAPVEMIGGRRYKKHRGMASPGAIREGGILRYGLELTRQTIIPQGVEGLVPASGPVSRAMNDLIESLRISFEDVGCASLAHLHQKVDKGEVCFELYSPAAKKEGEPHDILQV